MNRPAVGYVLAAVALTVLALTYASFFAPIEKTSFGVSVYAAAGANGRVTSVVPGSGAEHAGIHRGAIVDLSALTLSDRMRLEVGRSPVGTPLTIRIIAPGNARSATLYAQPYNRPMPLDFIAAALLGGTIALLVIALVVARRPSLVTAALVLYGMGVPQSFGVDALFSWIPNPLFGPIAVLCNLFVAQLPLWALLPFIVRFPEEPQNAAARRAARIADALFLLAVAVFTVQVVYEPLLFISWGAFDTWTDYAALAAVIGFTALAYGRTAGEQRRRVGWVLVGVAIAAIGYTILDFAHIFDLSSGSHLLQTVEDVALAIQAALPIALGYAILRHRVLDVGFALNRTMVFGVMTALVVIVVSFVDWLTTRMLSSERLALAIEALVTIGFGVALNWIHGRTERVIDRIVFRARHIAEKRIEYRIGALDFAPTDVFVDQSVAIEAPRILDLHSAAIFRRVAESEPFARVAATGWSERDLLHIGDDSLLVTTLRSLERTIVLDDVAIHDDRFPQGEPRPALAIPIVSQHELIGFALFGNRNDGALPDPEEMALLARLCHAAGNGYAMVEARRWREHAAVLERSMAAMTV
jgi:GAF domain-containing protein